MEKSLSGQNMTLHLTYGYKGGASTYPVLLTGALVAEPGMTATWPSDVSGQHTGISSLHSTWL